MAHFMKLAIEDLTYEEVNGTKCLYYKNKTITCSFYCNRVLVGFPINNFQYKVEVYDEKNNILYQVSSWTLLSDSNYSTSGDYGIGTFDIVLNSPKRIGKIKLYGKGKSWVESNAFSSEWSFSGSGGNVYKSLSFNTSSGYASNGGTLIDDQRILPYPICEVANPDNIKIVGGAPNKSFTNNKYHDGQLRIYMPSMTYLGETVVPSEVVIIDSNNISRTFTNNGTSNGLVSFEFSKEDILLAPYHLTYKCSQGGYYVYVLEQTIYPVSHFINNCLDISGIIAKAYEVSNWGKEEDSNSLWVTFGSSIEGKIIINDSSDAPYYVHNSQVNYCIDTAIPSDNYNIYDKNCTTFSSNGTILTLKKLNPYGQYTHFIEETLNNFNSFNKTNNYYIIIELMECFSSDIKCVAIPLTNISYTEPPIIFEEALEYSIKTPDQIEFISPLILNRGEFLKIGLKENQIYFPSLQKRYVDLTAEEREELELSYSINYYLHNGQGQQYPEYSGTIQNTSFNKEYDSIYDNSTYTRFLKIELIIMSQGFSTLSSMKEVRLGRTQPMKISSCQIKSGILTYYLKDYGGDKTETISSSNFIPKSSSLSRNGNESISLNFINSEGNTIKIIKLSQEDLGGIDKARENFYENIPIRLPLSSFMTPEQIGEIVEIEGNYNYSYSGSVEVQIIQLEFLTPLNNVTNVPTWGMRKNGVIINGKSRQELRPVKNESDEEIGIYFIEINSLSPTDRIIINFPTAQGTTNGEIYYNSSDNKIHLKGFIIDS